MISCTKSTSSIFISISNFFQGRIKLVCCLRFMVRYTITGSRQNKFVEISLSCFDIRRQTTQIKLKITYVFKYIIPNMRTRKILSIIYDEKFQLLLNSITLKLEHHTITSQKKRKNYQKLNLEVEVNEKQSRQQEGWCIIDEVEKLKKMM